MGLATIIKKTRLKEREIRILVLGLDNSGKSSIVSRWLRQDPLNVAPTFGFAIHAIPTANNLLVNVWDVGGQKSIRAFWRNYFEQTDGVVWVVDAAAPSRLSECISELESLLGSQTVPVIVMLNKQDIQGSMTLQQLEQILQHKWKTVGCSAWTGQNVEAAFDWLIQEIQDRLFHK